jgi:hypothetical protein
MAGSPQSTPAPPLWIEESSFRETFLQSIDEPVKRETVRRAGGVFYLALLNATYDNGTTPEDPSATRAELRAIAADLRYLQGYAAMVGRSAVDCCLDPAEEADALYAGWPRRLPHSPAQSRRACNNETPTPVPTRRSPRRGHAGRSTSSCCGCGMRTAARAAQRARGDARFRLSYATLW